MNTRPADGRAPSAAGADEETTTVPVGEESVHVDTAHVDQGGLRITKTVEARQQTVEQWLRHRRVTVERRPLGVLLPEGCDMPESHHEGDVLVIPVVEEVLVTTTRLRIVEEVHVTFVDGRDRSVQSVTLLKEAIRIERLDAGLSAAGSS